MSQLIAAELLKLRTTRSSIGLAIATLLVVGFLVVLTLALTSRLGGEDGIRSLLSTAGAGGLLIMVLGVVASAGEYRHGTIAATLLVAPDRLRVMTAKVIASIAVGAGIGIAAAALTAAIALPWLSARGAALTLSTGEVIGQFAGGVLYNGLAAPLGVAIGALLRNQIAAVVLVMVVLFVVDPTLSVLIEDYAEYSLTGLSVAMAGAQDAADELLPVWAAALIWGGYTLAVIAAATIALRRRDL